jgi:hypothetical protein
MTEFQVWRDACYRCGGPLDYDDDCSHCSPDRSDRTTLASASTKNSVRLNWRVRTGGRRLETWQGIPLNPRTGEVDVVRALNAGADPKLIAEAILRVSSARG